MPSDSPIIGLLAEKTLHAAVKRRLSPDPATHEVRLGRFVADIYANGEVFEVQTGGFGRLRRKLAAFLAVCPVTVVFPIAASKRLYWIGDGGVVSGGRLSPRREKPCAVLPELYQLGAAAFAPGLSVWVLPAEIEEYRYQDGFGKDRKTRARRCDRVPLSFAPAIRIQAPADCLPLLPTLPPVFTQKAFAKAAGLSPLRAWCALQFLQTHGLAAFAGKTGNAFLFSLVPKP